MLEQVKHILQNSTRCRIRGGWSNRHYDGLEAEGASKTQFIDSNFLYVFTPKWRPYDAIKARDSIQTGNWTFSNGSSSNSGQAHYSL